MINYMAPKQFEDTMESSKQTCPKTMDRSSLLPDQNRKNLDLIILLSLGDIPVANHFSGFIAKKSEVILLLLN